jgi:hypothetical protein
MSIIAITGGRDVHPSQQQLDAFARYLDACRCAVLRHGECPTGVDEFVSKSIARSRPRVRIEGWPAQWERLGRAAGPKRNREMLVGGICPRVDTLVHWPGGRGTAGCVELAATLGIPTIPIGDIVRGYLHPLPARRS